MQKSDRYSTCVLVQAYANLHGHDFDQLLMLKSNPTHDSDAYCESISHIL